MNAEKILEEKDLRAGTMSQKPSELKPWLKLHTRTYPDVATAQCSAYEYLCRRNSGYSGTALSYLDTEISYPKLFDKIQQTARALRRAGVKKGDIVTMCSVMTPELIYLFYALDILGATPNMVDPRTSAQGMREYVEEVDSRLVVSLDVAYPRMAKAVEGTSVKKVIVLSPVETLPAFKRFLYGLKNKDTNTYAANVVRWKDFFASGAVGKEIPSSFDPDHAVVIVHTGGTTGSPKGVMLGDAALNALALQNSIYEFVPGESYLNIMPPFIAYGYGVGVHTPLSYSQKVVVIPQFNPEEFGPLLLKYRTERTAGVPAHYQILMKDARMKGKDLSFLKVSGAGGDAINTGAEAEVNEFFREHNVPYKLNKGYGMTECASTAVTCVFQHNKLGSVGIPLYYTDVGIFEPGTDQELDFNDFGELCVSGPNLMMGYYNNPRETANVLRVHSDGKTWLHTGDIARMDEDGFVFINARIKRVIIRHDGFKIFPTAIENVVGAHKDVETCCAVRIRDSEHVQGDLPIMHVVLKKSAKQNGEAVRKELKALCAEKLAEYVQPVDFILDDALPYTGIGKIDYRALEERYASTAEL